MYIFVFPLGGHCVESVLNTWDWRVPLVEMATIGSGLMMADNMTEKAEKMVSYVLDHAKKGDPASLLASADKYCYTVQKLMNVGEIKGKQKRLSQ